MANFIDRRPNPRDKSLGNRQRFLQRHKNEIAQRISGKPIGDKSDTEVTITTDEPQFRLGQGGDRTRVYPGNKKFVSGDEIPRPEGGKSNGSGGNGGPDGSDTFTFYLNYDELSKLLMDGLELPDFVKPGGQEDDVRNQRAGYSPNGNPTNLNLLRTMKEARARHFALGRPSEDAIEKAERELKDALERGDAEEARAAQFNIMLMQQKRSGISFLDPLDLRYNRFEPKPKPGRQAVMFCMMDVSASMDERKKKMAKQFFACVRMLVEKKHQKVQVVYLRHTDDADEVPHDVFFHDKKNGGTTVSSVLKLMVDVFTKRFLPSEWNIYGAQASDGDNSAADNAICVDLLQNRILPNCQHFCYMDVETSEWTKGVNAIWDSYAGLAGKSRNFALKKATELGQVYPAFREIFAKRTSRPLTAAWQPTYESLQS